MAVSKEDILETISSMTVMEVVDLIEAMEEKFGVSAAAAVAGLTKCVRPPLPCLPSKFLFDVDAHRSPGSN